MILTIGNKYADKMDYEKYVGLEAMAVDHMRALVTVLILTGDHSGARFDIHKEDALVETVENENIYYAVAVYSATKKGKGTPKGPDKLYYTKHRKMADFIESTLGFGTPHRRYDNVTIDWMMKDYDHFTHHNVDDEMDAASKKYRDTFQAFNTKIPDKKELDEVTQKALDLAKEISAANQDVFKKFNPKPEEPKFMKFDGKKFWIEDKDMDGPVPF